MNLYAVHILEERKWKLPPIIMGQHLNKHLKEIIKNSDMKNETARSLKTGEKVYLRDVISSKIARKTFVSMNEDFGIRRSVSNSMSNHSDKEGNASDKYRNGEDKYNWEHKLEAVERWNAEYYKLFPNKIPKDDRKVLKLANGGKLILMGDRVVSFG